MGKVMSISEKKKKKKKTAHIYSYSFRFIQPVYATDTTYLDTPSLAYTESNNIYKR